MRYSPAHCAFSVVVGAVFGCAGCVGGPIGSEQSALAVCSSGPVTQGIDVSHYDGTIDWASAHAGGIDFAFMKATENINFVDPQFATNWQSAGAAGVIRGAYHFFRPEVDPVAQADYFIAHAGIPAPGDLPLTLDLEVTDTDTAAQAAQSALLFLARVKAQTGRTPIVYTSTGFLDSTLGSPAGFGGYTLWVANWQVSCPNLPSAWSDWRFWQKADNGTVAGISGTANVDLDEFNGSLAELQTFAGDDGGSSGDGGSGDAGSGVDGGVASPGDAGASGDLGAAGESDGGTIKRPAKLGGCAVGGDGAMGGGWPLLLLALSRAWARPARSARRRRA
jgi:GH25 family lysozyme M1 (1,4-beta-N-acetylmuramidase)